MSAIQILPIDGEDHAHATPTGRCVVLNNDLSDMTSDILQVTNGEILVMIKVNQSMSDI